MLNQIHPEAESLNKAIQKLNPMIYDLFSPRGKKIYYPSKGILAQDKDARTKEINATIGIALEDDTSPMALEGVLENLNTKNINKKEAFPYAPSFGVQALREKWKEKIVEKNPTLKGKLIGSPIVSAGLTHALSVLGFLFMNESDTLFHSDLFWDNYSLIFSNGCDVNMKPFNFFNNGDFDSESFEKTINEGEIGKKIIILNFPNNPAGYTPTVKAAARIKDALKKLAEKGNQVIVIMDDAYFGLVFEEGIYKESLFAELADLHENLLAVKVDGVTKEEYAWGFRIGFITYGIKNGTAELYTALENKTAGAVRCNISNACHLTQTLVLKAFNSPSYKADKEAKFNKMKVRFETVKQVLARHPEYKEYFDPLPFNSGYFMCLRPRGLDVEEIRQEMLKNFSSGIIALRDQGVLRIAFSSTPTDKLEKVFDDIYRACKKMTA